MEKLERRLSSGTLLVLILGFALSFMLYWAIEKQDTQRILAQLQRDADEHAVRIRSELELTYNALEGIRGLFDASDRVDRDEFRVFVQPFLTKISGIHALEWVPIIDQSERNDFETSIRNEGFPTFTMTQRQPHGTMVPATPRSVHYPICFVEPFTTNRKAFGYDLASSDTRREALERARDTGMLQKTEPISLVQESGTQYGFLAFLPIYKGSPSTVEERRSQLLGFALGVFRMGDILTAALRKMNRTTLGIDLHLIDISAPTDKRTLHHLTLPSNQTLSSDFHYKTTLPIASDRSWKLIATPSEQYLSSRRTWTSRISLVSGYILTLLTALLVQNSTNRTHDVERLITIRTRKLRESEQENRSIVETAVTALISITETGIIERFNPAAEKMFGYTQEEVVGRNVKLLMPEPTQSRHDGYLHSHAETGRKTIIGTGREVEGQRKDGTLIPLHLSVGEHEINGKKQYVGFLLDLTEQKKADRMKHEFVSTVSHELRTPLTSIKGSLSLIAGGVFGTVPEKMLSMLNKAIDNTERLTLLINDLLDMEKMQAGKLEIRKQPLDPLALIETALSSNQGFADSYGVTLLLIEREWPSRQLIGDEQRLLQVLSNLISNAVKFSEKGESVELDLTERNGWIRISVTDHGPGIPESFQKHVFEHFSQADGTDTKQRGGTGLGLAISKSIVESLAGRIGFETEAGKGTRFFIELPETGVPDDNG
ncbi:MAG: CHASE domain-containing protein [Magnetococcales bacterium]|nr:CHASE domain-containing protein [Magnetococcales bacterium]